MWSNVRRRVRLDGTSHIVTKGKFRFRNDPRGKPPRMLVRRQTPVSLLPNECTFDPRRREEYSNRFGLAAYYLTFVQGAEKLRASCFCVSRIKVMKLKSLKS